MRRAMACGFCVLLLAFVGWLAAQAPADPQGSLAEFLPAGAQLVLEARDFSELLSDWNSSAEKSRWLQSGNYRAFSRSRLFLRLSEVHSEFASGAGFRPDLDWLESVAGERSALGLYDIGNLHFLYVTELASARAVETVLWQKRADFDPRNVAGRTYYVREDEESGRVVAFASTDEYLLIATREDLAAGALAQMFEEQDAGVRGEAWFRDAVEAAPEAGELRLALNLDALVGSPYLRSYWIQNNLPELRQYRSGVVDVHRGEGEIREERVFLRRDAEQEQPAEPPPGDVLPRLVRLAPERIGLYRAWAGPSRNDAAARLAVLLAPAGDSPAPSTAAPGVQLTGGTAGSESALETRIDEKPPANRAGSLDRAALWELLPDGLLGMLELGSARLPDQGVFAGFESAVVLLASEDWDGETARESLLTAVEDLWTTSRLGAQWVEEQAGGAVYHRLNGLASVAVAVQGPVLAVSNSEALLQDVLPRMGSEPSGQPATYAARFAHAAERGRFYRLMGQLDFARLSRYGAEQPAPNRPPEFFSGNVASLSRTLARVESASILSRDEGGHVKQTVRYRLGP